MTRFFTYILVFIFGALSAQNQTIPHLSVEEGNIELLTQSVEVNVVGEVSDVRLYQTFKVQDTNSAHYLFPVGLETSLYELMVFYPDKIISLDVRNMDNIRKQVLAENKRGKKITLIHSADPHFLKLNLNDLPQEEEIKVVVKFMQNLEKEGNVKSVTLPTFLSENYVDSMNEFEFQVNLISPTPIYDSKITNYQV